MSMNFSRLSLLVCACTAAFLLVACQSVRPNYTEPKEGEVAKLRVTFEGIDSKNLHVNFHDGDLCDVKGTKFVGLLNAGVAGYPNVKQLEINIPSGRHIGVSMPQYTLEAFGGIYPGATNTFSVVQPIVSFSPEQGASYTVVFGPKRVRLIKDGNRPASDVSTALPQGCEVVWENLANKENYEDSHLRRK
ncbi:hypothetical protein [Variovorax atrisoli]|uniref:hypothetical protein n=1 Tax=Variovorax atrisoli TaxID=3394203 RepID=UPI0012FDFC5C|nr:hypothetical protein [Variovorax paradoxus]